ncbi:MAG: BrnT family toxin [Thermodesulfobacteriota bacterium]
MLYFDWNNEKNEKLREERGICFEEIILAIEKGDVLDILEHPDQEKYKNQKIFVIKAYDYAWLVPFVETESEVFLKTIIPSRKATKKYLRGGKKND